MNMALSTTTPYFSIQANKITNYTSPIFLQKQGQISIINGFSPLYKPLTQSKPSSRRTLLTIPAFSSSQGVGALVGSESNLSLLDKALVFDLNGNGIPISDLWKDRKAVVAFARHFGCVFCRKRADYLASKKRSRSCNTICFAKPNASWSEFVGKFSISSAQTRTINQSGNTCSCRCWVLDSELQEEVTPPLPVKIVSIYEDGSISPLKSAPWQDVLLHTEQMDAAGVALILIGPGNIDQAKAFYEQTKFGGEVYADPDHSSYGALNFVSGASTTFTPKAGLKIIQLYMEGYRQDWGLSFQKDTVSRGGWQQGGIIVAGPGKTNISYIHKDKEAGDDPPIEDILKACCSYEMKS